MGERGFTIVEVMVVVTIVGILLLLASLQFSSYAQKANIESQVRSMYADVMEARSQAMLQKVDRSVNVTSNGYAIYPSQTGTGIPVLQKTFKFQTVSDSPLIVSFDTRGVANVSKTVCVEPAGNSATIDSIRITETMIQMGKWSGGVCDKDHFTAK
jgi:prepilin-type N-terminal cleavage/methylation domain-containing protein